MKQNTKRLICIILAAILCLGLLAGIAPAISATSLVDYQYGSGSYSNYVYNWGTRGSLATFLSPKAEAFYADNDVTYDELAALSGSTNTSSVPSSALYQELRDLMVSNHDYETTYDATKNLFQFTDCQDGGGKISSFYTGAEIGPAWDGAWNREHTWPNSKDDDNGNGENDLIMLRPTTTSENSSRGNTAYGQSSGYYNPNTPSDNTYDLRGDVARIILFVYVRWRALSSSDPVFGADGVIESKDVLLEWIAADPVDTWEMGRNDSTESITGTRNVFVDYPELAYALFNEGVPGDMLTPSGEAQGNGYTITTQIDDPTQGSATVTGRVISVTPAEGYALTGYTVTSGTAEITRDGNRLVVNASSDCTVKLTFSAKTPATITLTMNGETASTISSYVGDTVTLPGYLATTPADHTFAGWVTADVAAGSSKPATVYTTGSSYTVTGNAELKALYATFDATAGTGSSYQQYSGALTEGDYLLTYNNGALKAEVSSANRFNYTDVTVAGNTVEAPDASLVWQVVENDDGTFSLYNAAVAQYAAATTTNNKGALIAEITDYAKWTVTGTSTYDFANVGNGRYLRRNETYGFAAYASQTGGELTLYKATSGASIYTTAVEGFTPGALTYTTIPQAVAIGEAMADQTFTTEKYYVSGIITEIENSTYGNLYIADAEGNVLKIYGTYDATGTNKYEALAVKPKVGDTVVLYGILGNYGGEAEMKDAWIMDHVVGDGSNIPDVPTTTVTLVTTPAADTAYKFGLTQVNKGNAVYYLNGKMANTYYLGTTEAVKSAVDVYLEETTGGYYLYAAIDGGRKYLNTVVSGTHVNGVYADTAATVYTYDAEKMTLVATVNGEAYAFGTYKEYTTAGPIKADDGFFCNFYTVDTTGGTEPEPAKDGWVEEGGIWYYYENNVKVTNAWREDSVGWCYLTADGSMATNTFVKDSVGWAYVDASGYYYKTNGWKQVDGVWYYLKQGYRVENAWQQDSKGWCYLTADGSMAVNTFVKDSVGWAYVDKSGYYYKINGWKQVDGVWYYLEQGYRVQSAWRKDSKGWCYLTEDGSMAVNTFVKDSVGWAYVDASGYYYKINGWKQVDGEWYYLEQGYRVQSTWRKDSKGWCYLTEDGSMMTDSWLKDSVGWCYIDSNGYCLAGGTYTVDGHQYTFDANGRIEGEPIV